MVGMRGRGSQRAGSGGAWESCQKVSRSIVFWGLQAGGQEGVILGVRFSRPFAPCFSRLVVVSDVYLVDHTTPIPFTRIVQLEQFATDALVSMNRQQKNRYQLAQIGGSARNSLLCTCKSQKCLAAQGNPECPLRNSSRRYSCGVLLNALIACSALLLFHGTPS